MRYLRVMFWKLGKKLNVEKTPKEKKEEKAKSGVMSKLSNFMKKIGQIFRNIVNFVIDLVAAIAIPVAKIFAKCISILLKPIVAFIWTSGIGIALLLISAGILLISLAVKKLVDYVVDDLGPIIKEKLQQIDAETLNHVLRSGADFLDNFNRIMTALFAPVIAIGEIIKRTIEPIG